jgi:hypothetical protein
LEIAVLWAIALQCKFHCCFSKEQSFAAARHKPGVTKAWDENAKKKAPINSANIVAARAMILNKKC